MAAPISAGGHGIATMMNGVPGNSGLRECPRMFPARPGGVRGVQPGYGRQGAEISESEDGVNGKVEGVCATFGGKHREG